VKARSVDRRCGTDPRTDPIRQKANPGFVVIDRGTLFFAESTRMSTTARSEATEEDLLRTPKDGCKYELVDGQIRMSPAGTRHGRVCVRLVVRLDAFVEKERLGYVFDSSTGFRLTGGNVRAPDVSFVARGRFRNEQVPEGFGDLAPDLAVEVLSPEDRSRDLLDKVGEYLQAGVPLVWVIDPRRRTAAAYRSLTDVRTLGPDEALEGGEVLPGFRCALGELFD
jgi:Uma2 family endonuclease